MRQEEGASRGAADEPNAAIAGRRQPAERKEEDAEPVADEEGEGHSPVGRAWERDRDQGGDDGGHEQRRDEEFAGEREEVGLNALFNPYAAVPSMHVGFALMLSVPMIRMARHGWAKALWVGDAPVVTGVVVLTANHWIFDAVTGAAVAGVSAVAAQTVLARVRPEAWAWAPEDSRPSGSRAGWIGCPADGDARLPGRDPQSADRVPAHAECDLADPASVCAWWLQP